jgi:hypothetical protein
MICPVCGNPWSEDMAGCVFCGHVKGAPSMPVEVLPPVSSMVREPGRNTTDTGVPPLPLAPALLIIGATNVPIPVEPGEVILGRLSSDDRIGKALNAHDDVSRFHTALTVRGSRVEVRDLGSMHGTWTEDNRRLAAKVTEYFELPVMLRLGPSCYVRVEPRQ